MQCVRELLDAFGHEFDLQAEGRRGRKRNQEDGGDPAIEAARLKKQLAYQKNKWIS